MEPQPTIGVVYVARGADDAALEKFARFRASYDRHAAGAAHRLYVVFKGFANAAALRQAEAVFGGVPHTGLYFDDADFDLGAYYRAAANIEERLLCCVNTASVILGDQWLRKLLANHSLPGIVMVGCSASWEAPQHPGVRCPTFPNPHLRSNAFLIERRTFIAARRGASFDTKLGTHLFEHGYDGLTRRLTTRGGKVLLVGRDGRGYAPGWWIRSDTFRQGDQTNLLIGDNQSANFRAAPIAEKKALFHLAWGDGTIGQVAL